jgi:osmotically inducible protein OsmC
MKRKASAVWNGNLTKGKGTISTESGVLEAAQYSFSTRFENGRGTNPEELIAAAHAGCFTMALSLALQQAGFTADTLNTTATLTMENLPTTSWTVTAIHLETTAKVPGVSGEQFATVAAGAKAGCPISRLLNAEITLFGHH